MHHRRIGTLRSIGADEVSTLILPTDITRMNINSIQPAFSALLAYYRQFAVRRKAQSNQLAYAKGTFPFLMSFIVPYRWALIIFSSDVSVKPVNVSFDISISLPVAFSNA